MLFKSLLKKQWWAFAGFFVQAKDGKRRSPAAIAGFSLLMLVALASVGFMMYMLGEMLCAPLVEQGRAWLYFAFMGSIATALGIVGSLFTAKASLYEAKDNDLLLSMPIPSWLILCTRVAGLYALIFLFEAMVFVPALIVYFVAVKFSVTVLLLGLVCLLILPLGALTLSCILGWLLALLAAKLPWKNFLTTLFSVLFLVLYFIVYSKINEYLTYVITNGALVAQKMKTLLFPFWKMGLACTGDGLALLWYALLFIGSFALVYLLLAKTYLHLATANRGGKKAKYKSKEGKQGFGFVALLKKEAMRFTKNPMIALNCFLGTVFLVVLPIAATFLEELTVALRETAGIQEIVTMIAAIAICEVMSMNMVSAAAVSLEGENLWISRSLPIETEKILLAKAAFHFLITAIPALFASVFFAILYRLGVYTLALVAISLLFSAYCALFGLLVNLKMPNLHWTNELMAVKQSFSAILSMFVEWGAMLLLVGGYFLFGKYMFAGGYLLVCIALLAAANALLWVWHSRRGTKIFENL